MNAFLKLISPRSTRDGIALAMIFVLILMAANFVFFHAVGGDLNPPVTFIILQSIVIGGPFVTMGVIITTHQLGSLRRLSLLSRKDGLTGLNNRRTFIELAQKRLESMGRGVLVLLDADHFKRVNDEYGHSVGDQCLEEIAHRLKWNLRVDDVAGRIGGEEFAVFFAGATIEQVRVIGQRIGQPIPFRSNGQDDHLTITLSMGAVEIDPLQTLDEHLIRADDALYAAKDAGRACMIVWSADLSKPVDHKPLAGRKGQQSAA